MFASRSMRREHLSGVYYSEISIPQLTGGGNDGLIRSADTITVLIQYVEIRVLDNESVVVSPPVNSVSSGGYNLFHPRDDPRFCCSLHNAQHLWDSIGTFTREKQVLLEDQIKCINSDHRRKRVEIVFH